MQLPPWIPDTDEGRMFWQAMVKGLEAQPWWKEMTRILKERHDATP